MAKGHIIVGLDIGTNMTKVLVAVKNPNKEEFEVLSLVQEPSLGVRKGVVFNTENVTEIYQIALKKAEEESDRKIDSVYVNIGGAHIFSTFSHGLVSVSRADRKIPEEDVDRVLQAAQTVSLPSNKKILKVLPKEFIVDGERGLKDPVGMEGVRLEADVLAVGVFIPYLNNLTHAISNAGVQINDVIPSPMASARAVVKKREKELGVMMIEIGAGTTGIAIYEEGDLIHTSVLPIGSANITNDIAAGLKIDVDLAEKIKIEFGNCLHRGPDKKEKIELEEEESMTFSHKQVAEIVGSRVSEIFDEVNKELKKLQKPVQLPGGVVLTGGGAKLPRILELAKKELKMYCRIGKPLGYSPEQDDTSLATVCGLVAEGFDAEKSGNYSFDLSFGKKVGSKIRNILKSFIP
ncbi:MAG: cell division protein FtsA [Patescibacteria group bacterium]